MMMMTTSILASVLIGLGSPVQPDPASILRPETRRQQQNAEPGPIADLPQGVQTPSEMADFGNRRITGIVMSRFGRVFVCSPAAANEPGSWLVAERMSDGSLVSYPPADPLKPLVLTGVTAIHIDAQDRLWILDSANPDAKGVQRKVGSGALGAGDSVGPKMVCVELSTNEINRVWNFNESIAPPTSMLADLRVFSNDKRKSVRDDQGREAMDPVVMYGDTNWVFITDAGGADAGGALLAVNTNAGKVRRLLSGHASTKAEPGFVARIGTTELKGEAAPTALNADAIALDGINDVLYWQPLGSRTLYSIKTAFMRDSAVKGEELASKVNTLGPTVMATSMQFDAQGTLYFAAVEREEIVTRSPSGTLATFARSPALGWVEGLSFGEDAIKRAVMLAPATRMYGPAGEGSFKVMMAPLGVKK